MLQQLVADGSMHALSGTAFAVTPTLRESYSEGDEDELGEVALREAALASLRLLAAEQESRAETATGGACRCGGRCSSPRSTARRLGPTSTTRWCGCGSGRRSADVVAAYVDNAAAEPAVSAAIEVIDSADLGDEDAEFTVGDAQDHDLAWYASQELPFLLDLL